MPGFEPSPLVVGLGEALFDCFPDRQVLGGAPVNLAVHLNTLLQPIGGSAVPATRVGEDDLGRRFLSELEQRGVETRWVQVDANRPTGVVKVKPHSDGETSYQFADNAAWDALELTDAWQELAENCHAIAFGTLAQRAPVSRETIETMLLAAPQAVRLLDVNLRQDFYDRATLDRSLQLATAAKLNRAELAITTNLLGLANEPAILAEAYSLDWIAITDGAAGTTLWHDGVPFTSPVPSLPPAAGADSVGAGDACSAGLLFGALQGWPFDKTVQLANTLGAYVASQPGATPPLPPELLALSQTFGEA